MTEKLIAQLNAPGREQRLAAAAALAKMIAEGERPVCTGDTNNHVHTTYSFSPYSPAKAVYTAYMSGLQTVGIVDHDAINGAQEFIDAGRLFGITTTVGLEIRADFSGTGVNGRMLNNPDQADSGYMTMQGIPHGAFGEIDAWLEKNVRRYRHIRNRKMIANINALMAPWGIALDYDADVLPLSMARDGGGVTERHLLFALAHRLMERFTGESLVRFLRGEMKLDIRPKTEALLLDTGCPIYDYDLLNVLKAGFIGKIFVPATDELPDAAGAVAFAKSVGAIPAICYLGDVGESVTGDKKAQKLEDAYLDELIGIYKAVGFEAVAYMPSRNTAAQIDRLAALCDENGLMQISGEDINQPRQSFICKTLREPRFAYLTDATWALVGHERAASENAAKAIYSDSVKAEYPLLSDRIEHYKKIGMEK